MNITDEKREEIVKEKNTAQDELVEILNKLDKMHADELRFENPMYGDLDFSILKDQDYKHISAIVFDKPGEVTNIRNIPSGIKQLHCSTQMLIEVSGLPDTLEDLNLENNYLTKFDAAGLVKLRILHLSNNDLDDIAHLPETLEELKCENNQLKQLDLANTLLLHTLHCSNNQLLIIANPPKSLIDFQMENNPLTEITYGEKTQNKNQNKKTEKKIDYLECMYEYFALKRKYEEKYRQMKKNAYDKGLNKKNSVKQARHVNPPCISCKRNVGTVFTNKNSKYTAICGDKTHPCNLNIQLYSGHSFNNETLLSIYHEDLEKTKENIIKQKMDTLFNYLSETESVDAFKQNLNTYNEDSKMYKDLLDRHKDLYENEERKLHISKKTQEIYKTIEEIDEHIKEYEKTGNRKSLTTAMNIQKRDLIPAILNRRLRQYEIMEVDISPENDSSKLVQYEIPLHKMDFSYGETERVIKFSI